LNTDPQGPATATLLIDPDFCPSPRVFRELLNGGQTFNWNERETGSGQWFGSVGNTPVLCFQNEDKRICVQALAPVHTGTWVSTLREYFAIGEAYEKQMESLPTAHDPYLAQCVDRFPGLRILKQPIEEALLSFLCSSNKQVTQIKRMIDLLRLRFGKDLGASIHSYPIWSLVDEAPESELRACGCGYRAAYIKKTARFLNEHPDFLPEVQSAPYAIAHQNLTRLPGVGDKVADCVLLYGAKRMEAFPLDTWMIKALEQRYFLKATSRKSKLEWIRGHFGPNAGLAQQFIFAYEREVNELRPLRPSARSS
jgi:N-glycosylase/DNA lyase